MNIFNKIKNKLFPPKRLPKWHPYSFWDNKYDDRWDELYGHLKR